MVGAPEVEDSLIEVPKVLGDVFEAVVCAVFLDSGMDLDLVWKIYQPLFMPFIGMISLVFKVNCRMFAVFCFMKVKLYPILFFILEEYYKDNIPRSPIRILKETFPEGNQVIFRYVVWLHAVK